LSKVIGIIGSRRRDSGVDKLLLTELLAKHFEAGDTLVSGGCPQGGDRFAEEIAKDRGLTITIHYPDWAKNGKFAGLARNTLIARDCDTLLALVASDRTGGAEDTIKKACKLGKTVVTIS